MLLKGYFKGYKQGFISFVFIALALFSLTTVAERPYFAQRPAKANIPDHLLEAFANRFQNARHVKKAIDANRRHAAALFNSTGVIGSGVGWAEGNQAVVKLYLEASASSAGLPAFVDGIPVVIERTGTIYALNVGCGQNNSCEPDNNVEATTGSEPALQTDWHERPVPIGTSVSRAYGYEAGTLACRVSGGCHAYALSNAHVFAGRDLSTPVGTNVLQPGRYDGGTNPDDAIGMLYKSIPIVIGTDPYFVDNRVDAAIAETTSSMVGVATRSDGYGTPRMEPLAPAAGLNVMKYGRTTGLTYGYIEAIDVMINVAYDDLGEQVALFKGQFIIRGNGGTSFSSSGDSGSLVVASGGADDRRPVGLIFAAGLDSNNAPISVANNIEDVLTLLEVSIDGDL
ncbi:MAG: hypothetical protein GY746_17005 [Gammaproteobacteria bacterium]|nr:hypothetical protein [Gammaproteobacteria bacterium]MCP4275375.1 hypothetical protein [Gammaproteobacteria bacterium]MCP4832205.1 hypothetical protein [Gammaproteobacteria bacterium]MCP4928161.1 hypothetical protein [Gammaproteobacteria bacterium]